MQPLGDVGIAGITYNKNRTLLRDLILKTDPADLAKIRQELAANTKLIDQKLAQQASTRTDTPRPCWRGCARTW